MYRATQEKGDWLARTGSHATRPVLAANMSPARPADFETGRLAELLDEQKRLRIALQAKNRQHLTQQRLAVVNAEIKRLNRLASETREQALIWQAINMTFTPKQREKLSANLMRVRMEAEGYSTNEIANLYAEIGAQT